MKLCTHCKQPVKGHTGPLGKNCPNEMASSQENSADLVTETLDTGPPLPPMRTQQPPPQGTQPPPVTNTVPLVSNAAIQSTLAQSLPLGIHPPPLPHGSQPMVPQVSNPAILTNLVSQMTALTACITKLHGNLTSNTQVSAHAPSVAHSSASAQAPSHAPTATQMSVTTHTSSAPHLSHIPSVAQIPSLSTLPPGVAMAPPASATMMYTPVCAQATHTANHASSGASKKGTSFLSRNVTLSRSIMASISAGEFINFGEILYILDAETAQNNEKPADRKSIKVNNFYSWLRCWNVYEETIMNVHSHIYSHLASYRQFIQDCDGKYTWTAVSMYDTRFRSLLACSTRKFDFGIINSDLFVTTLDATAVKQPKSSIQCFRCKGDHKAAECTFQASSTMEEKKGLTTTAKQPKQPKWYHNDREGCNNYQNDKCRYEHCTRAHVCRLCRGPDPLIKCRRCQEHSASSGQ